MPRTYRSVEDRICHHCNEIETELHVLIGCPFYDDTRETILKEYRTRLENEFELKVYMYKNCHFLIHVVFESCAKSM